MISDRRQPLASSGFAPPCPFQLRSFNSSQTYLFADNKRAQTSWDPVPLQNSLPSSMSNFTPLCGSICRALKPRPLPLSRPAAYHRLCSKLQRRHHSPLIESARPITLPSETPNVSKIFSKIYMNFPRARRRFSTTPTPAHGHTTPPKPGEEYANPMPQRRSTRA